MSWMWKKTTDFVWDTKSSVDSRLEMEGLLKQARKSLTYYFSKTPEKNILNADERISKQLMRNARGIAFITELKGGFLFGVKGGSGIIITRTDDISQKMSNENTKFRPWSPPCAVGFAGVSVGFQGGMTKVDHIILLPTQAHIDLFMSDGQLQLKGTADLEVYKYGRNMDAGVGVGNKGIAPVVSYSFGVKGLYGGITLDGEVMTTRGYCNEMYYGKKNTIKDILQSTVQTNDNGQTYKADGSVRMPKQNRDYETLVQMINDYCIDENADNNNYNPPPLTMKTSKNSNNSNNAKEKLIKNNRSNNDNGPVLVVNEYDDDSDDDDDDEKYDMDIDGSEANLRRKKAKEQQQNGYKEHIFDQKVY